MKYAVEFNIDTFQFWGGAKTTLEEVKKAGKVDELSELIEEHFARNDGEVPTATEINDLLWWGRTDIYEALGISDGEEEDNA